MKRNLTCLSLMVLLILASMIVGGCGSSGKLGTSIKIETSIHSPRAAAERFDIYSAIEEKLEEAGFDVVSEKSTDYDFILYVYYLEEKGADYTTKFHGGSWSGTDITCEVKLYDKTQNLIWEQEIQATTADKAYNLYESAISNLEHKQAFYYLGENIASVIEGY